MADNLQKLLAELARPFAPGAISWKPGSTTKDGSKCMALAYADLRAYQDRLDEVMGIDWSCRYVPWEGSRIICELTIYIGDPLGRREPIVRSSTGEADAQDEKNNMAGSVSEAMAFKRACAMFGLGRYLYDLPSVWIEFDAQRKRISDAGQKELDARYAAWYARETAQTAPQRTQGTPAPKQTQAAPKTSQRAPTSPTAKPKASVDQVQQLDTLGMEFYGEKKWPEERTRLAKAASKGAVHQPTELMESEIAKLLTGLSDELAKKMAEVSVQTAQPIPH